jgi:hypothetical protein
MGKCSKKGHIKVYLEWCKALDIEPHSRAMLGLMSTSTDGYLNPRYDSGDDWLLISHLVGCSKVVWTQSSVVSPNSHHLLQKDFSTTLLSWLYVRMRYVFQLVCLWYLLTKDLSRRFNWLNKEASGDSSDTADQALWRKTSCIATPFMQSYCVVLTLQRIWSKRSSRYAGIRFSNHLGLKHTFSTSRARSLSLLMPGHHSLGTLTCQSLVTTLMCPSINPIIGN